VKTDLSLSGAVAQYGRASGLIQDVATQLIGQFANCLKSKLAASAPGQPAHSAAAQAAAPSAPPAAAKPISGFALMCTVLWNSIRRLFGGGK